jgi:nucleotide-binding universal stress UspA family protein
MGTFPIQDYRRHLTDEADRRLAQLLPANAASWCRPETRVETGKVYRQIIQVADETDTELIVMGVQGRGAVDRLLFGSTTHQVVRAARCPVLTLRQLDDAAG